MEHAQLCLTPVIGWLQAGGARAHRGGGAEGGATGPGPVVRGAAQEQVGLPPAPALVSTVHRV